MLSVFRLAIHTTLLVLMWNHPLTLEHCASAATLDPEITFMLVLYTIWMGFELGTTVTQTDFRKDMLLHHVFTIIGVLVGWKMQLVCSTYAIVRTTILCEPFVDLYFIFKDTKPLNIVTDTLMFLTFPYTRVVLMFVSVIKPILFNNVLDSRPTTVVGIIFTFMLYGMQCMWSFKVVRGGLSKLIG